MKRQLAALALAATLVACASGRDATPPDPTLTVTSAPPTTASPTTRSPPTPGPTTPAPTTPAPTTLVAPTTSTSATVTTPTTTAAVATIAPAFLGTSTPLPPAVRATMTGRSWRPGCPVGLDALRLLELSFWDLTGSARLGRLIVHGDHADAIVVVFRRLFEARFPIERMELVDAFGADDDASMAANNTSAFNCRRISGTSSWSEHAYGRAIDVNPRFNPWVTPGQVDPPNGAPFADRSQRLPGMIHPGDLVVQSFASIGWTWGGTFQRAKDYQHFSATGR